MLPKAIRGCSDAAPFLSSDLDSPIPFVISQKAHKARGLLKKRPRRPEDLLSDQMLELLHKMGVFAKKHVVDNRPRAGGGHIRAGLGLGVSDIVAVVPPYGRALFAELKLPGYSPSDVRPDQGRFLTTVRLHGAVAGIVTCEEDMIQLVQRARCLP